MYTNHDICFTEYRLNRCNCGIGSREKQTLTQRKTTETKSCDVNEKEIFNIKSIQTAFSTIDIKSTKCKYCEIRSKSQEDLTKVTKRQERESFSKKKDTNRREQQRDYTEWFEIHSDNIKFKLWGEQMQKIAERLRKPGGEEKLRLKIEEYLKKMPEQFSEVDNEGQEFRKQLPNNIIKQLKKMYSNPRENYINVYRMELKYGSRVKLEYFKRVVMNWVKTLNIKKRDILGIAVRKEDIFKFIVDKLGPFILDRPVSDIEYKIALKKNITDIMDDLSLLFSNYYKQFHLIKAMDTLVNDIFNIERKIISTYIHPTDKEIKDFVKDEIKNVLEKSRVTISTKRTEYLETELIDLLLDLTDISDFDDEVEEDVKKIFMDIPKLPEYKAKYFASLLLLDYKEFFFRESIFQENGTVSQGKGKENQGRPDVYSVFQNANEIVDFNSPKRFDIYTKRLIEEIRKWLSKIDIPNKHKNYIEFVVKDLAIDIVDRQKYLKLNSKNNETNPDEVEQLKYQIFKWTYKYIGEENKVILEQAHELMNIIKSIPKPLSEHELSYDQPILPQNTDTKTNTNPNIKRLTNEIYDWFHQLPVELQPQDTRLNNQIFMELAEVFEKNDKKKDEETIDKELDIWTEKVFQMKLNKCHLEQLKNRIRNIPHGKNDVEKDHRNEKVLIRFYEDLVDIWIDTLPIEPQKEGIFINNRNEYIHELGVKIYNLKTRYNKFPAEMVDKKLQEEISDWLKKLPLHPNVHKQNSRDKYASKLVQNTQAFNFDHSKEKQSLQNNEESFADQLKVVILDWLKKLPSYRNKSIPDKENQEQVMKLLANKLSEAINDGSSDADTHIVQHIRLLDPEQNYEAVLSTALILKRYLENNNMLPRLQRRNSTEDFFDENISFWLKNLPLDITDEIRFNNEKRDFIDSMKRLKYSGSDKAVIKKEILMFMASLPIDRYKKVDRIFLDKEASKLVQTLMAMPKKLPQKSNDVISESIIDWAYNLPLKYVRNPRELFSFIDDMSSVITTLLLHPEYNKAEENDLRLHKEIVKFLKRFPLKQEFSTEKHISNMTGELIKSLKDAQLYRGDSGRANNVAVYELSLNTNDNYSELSIQDTDVIRNWELYTKELVSQISEWFDQLNLTERGEEETFKEVVFNDLAGDIVDRHKYLELNPDSEGTKESELEHLRYQIFKWINKLVGEANTKPIENANALVERIQRIRKPTFMNPEFKAVTVQKGKLNPKVGSPADAIQESTKKQASTTTPISTTVTQQTISPATAGTTTTSTFTTSQSYQPVPTPVPITPQVASTPGVGITTLTPTSAPISPITPQEASTPGAVITTLTPTKPQVANTPGAVMTTPTTSTGTLTNFTGTKCCSRDLPPPLPPPSEGTKEAIYEKYQKIFKDKCNALPIDKSTPENAQLAELARIGIYNGIVKTFFKLKSDPEIENDYGYFEFMLEDKIEEMLDILPQTHDLKNKRNAWKIDILKNALEMLDQLHSLSDRSSFRQRVRNKFNRKFAQDLELEECFLLQQGFLAEIADAYLLETNYKEKDHIKTNVYKNRLMKKVDELTNHLSKEHNVGFRFFKKAQLARIAMNVLEQVPIPNDDILQEEAEEIRVADEIEKWYKELPTKPLVNETDGILRKRMMDLLAKKLYDIKKRSKDPNKEELMKHEMSQFLEKRAKLQQDQDLNINFMVDELNNRLKNNWLEAPTDYDAFKKDKPLSSTFAQVDNQEFLAPLMDAATSTPPPMKGSGFRDREAAGYMPQSGYPELRMGSPYGWNTGVDQGGTSRGYVSIPGSGQAGYNVTQEYISHQQPLMQSIDSQNPSPYKTRMSQYGPSERCGTQQCPTTNKAGLKVHASSPQGGRYGVHDDPRMQNINESLGQQLTSQAYDHNKIPGLRDGVPGQMRFAPNYLTPRQSRSEIPGYMGVFGQTTYQGTPTTGRVGSRAPGDNVEEVMDSDYELRCRCLEAYRKRLNCHEYDERCPRVPPYCPY